MCQTRGFVAGFATAAAVGAIIATLGFAPSQSGTKSDGQTPPKWDPPKMPEVKPPDLKIPAPKEPGMPAEIPMTEEEAKAMEAFMMPGPQHEWLAKKTGTWKGTIKHWMAPGAPPMETTGTSTFRMTLGGRYLIEDVKSEFMGMPFEATGVTGYHRGSNEFEFAWMDTMGTAISTGKGSLSADGKTLTWKSEMWDPMGRKNMSMRGVETMKGNDAMTYEMYAPGPDGKDMKVMEIDYARVK